MADFDNLLNEIDDDENTDVVSISERIDDTTESVNDITINANTTTTTIPPALLEAENRLQHPLSSNNSYHSDEENYQRNQDDENDFENYEGEDDEDDGLCRTDTDYETLRHNWIQELNCTEMLPYDEATNSVLLEVLSHQEDTMDQLQEQAGNFSGTGGGGALSGRVDPSLASLAAGICKMDSDRLAFVMADLMRTRLFKIEKYALHNREVLDRMSDGEISYLQHYGALLEQHMQRSVTDHITKDAWKKLDEPEMIEKPNLDSYVFCRVLADEVTLNNQIGIGLGAEEDDNDEVGEGTTEETFSGGSQIFVRYAVIRELVLKGKVELLM